VEIWRKQSAAQPATALNVEAEAELYATLTADGEQDSERE